MTKYLFVLLLLAGTAFGEGDITAFGPTDTVGYGGSADVVEARANTGASHRYTAGSADTVTWVHFVFRRASAEAGLDSLSFAIYTIVTDSIPATRVGITDRKLISSNLKVWDSIEFDPGVVLTEDVTYCLAYGDEAGDVVRYYKSGDLMNKAEGPALAGTWSPDGTITYSVVMYADIDTTDGAGASATVHARNAHLRDVEL